MKRNLSEATDRSYDLLIVGGGIHGLGIAWDAALRGLRVALVEENDFGSQTTAACFRIVHGGLRYLQHLDFWRLRSSVREQRTLRQIAPRYLSPLPFLVPTYGKGKKGQLFLRTGLNVYELLARDRNIGVAPEQQLPKHETLLAADVQREFPKINATDLSGGVVFYDAQMRNCERLTLAVAKAAAAEGATLLNYCRFLGASVNGGRWSARVHDLESEEELEIRARIIVNVAALGGDQVERSCGIESAATRTYVKGIQLVLPRIHERLSLALEGRATDESSVIKRGGKSFFLVPWGDFTFAGTYEVPTTGEKSLSVSEEELQSFLTELRASYDDERISRDTLRSFFAGKIPLEAEAGSAALKSDQWTPTPVPAPYLRVQAVKYTTFREIAEKSVNQICRLLSISLLSKTSETSLPGADEMERQASDDSEVRHLKDFYGSEFTKVRPLLTAEQSGFLDSGSSIHRAQVHYAVQSEMCLHLEDFVFRRTTLGLANSLTEADLAKLAEYMGSVCAWTKETRSRELERVWRRLKPR